MNLKITIQYSLLSFRHLSCLNNCLAQGIIFKRPNVETKGPFAYEKLKPHLRSRNLKPDSGVFLSEIQGTLSVGRLAFRKFHLLFCIDLVH